MAKKNKLFTLHYSLFTLYCLLFTLHYSLIFAQSKDLKDRQENTSDRALAIVGNESIFFSEYERVANPMIEDYKQKNKNVTEEKIQKFKKAILDEMVNNKLIIQQAKKEKMNVSRRQLDEQIKKIRDQFGPDSTFKAELRKEGLTEEKFEERIKEQLMAEELTYREVNSKIIAPAQEEIDNLFNLIKKKLTGETITGLAEQDEEDLNTLSQLVERYLKNKKAQGLYNNWVSDLKLKTNIKINPID